MMRLYQFHGVCLSSMIQLHITQCSWGLAAIAGDAGHVSTLRESLNGAVLTQIAAANICVWLANVIATLLSIREIIDSVKSV